MRDYTENNDTGVGIGDSVGVVVIGEE